MSVSAPPYFSIIIPAYNRGFVLDRTLRSCLDQTFPDFEVIVVDDGSEDDTAAVMARHPDPRIVYERQANAGASAARNRGVALARGSYVAFLDSDDTFLPGKLAAFRDAIEGAGKGPDAGVAWYSPLYFHRGAGNQLRKPSRGIRPDESVGDYLFAADGMMQTSTLVLPRELALRTPFDPGLRNLEDLDLCLRLEAAGATFRMIPDPQAIWYDDNSEGRLSHTTTTENVESWLSSQRSRLSGRAYHGFLARYLVPIALRREPVRAIRLLVAAVAHGSISPTRATTLAVRGVMPGTYGRVRDLVVSRRPSGASPPI